MRSIFPIASAIGILVCVAADIRAQSTSSQAPSPTIDVPPTSATVPSEPESDRGRVDAPADLRPFQLTLPRDHLSGDWYGARTELERMGIAPTLALETDVAANPTGGRSEGITEASNLGLDLAFDLDKLAGISSASFLLQVSQRWGNSLSEDYIGNVFTTQQVYGGQTFHLIDAAYQQKFFNDRIEIRAGRIAAGDDFLVSPYDYLFMQNAFDGNPVGIFFNTPGMTAYPNATWGALVKAHPTQRTYVMLGVYNGDPTIRKNSHNGADLSIDGPIFVMGEAGFQLNGMPGDPSRLLGDYKAGFWYDNGVLTEFGSARSKRGNSGVYALIDQVLVTFGTPQNNRGLGVFGSGMVSSDPSVGRLPYFFTAGFAARGIFSSRPRDTCGLGLAYGLFSEDLARAQRQEQLLDPTIVVQDHELVLELTYRFYFRNNALFFQPDLQYISHVGGSARFDDAVVIGSQIGINF